MGREGSAYSEKKGRRQLIPTRGQHQGGDLNTRERIGNLSKLPRFEEVFHGLMSEVSVKEKENGYNLGGKGIRSLVERVEIAFAYQGRWSVDRFWQGKQSCPWKLEVEAYQNKREGPT